MIQAFDLDFPRAHGDASGSALFRHTCEDFVVNEVLGYTPEGQGEHVFLEILKRDDNTPWIAKQIARLADVAPMDVGYCGLKDRRAVTRQWFSVYRPAQAAIDWTPLNGETCQLLSETRHPRKLRRGEHQGNQFIVRLRDYQGDNGELERRLTAIACHGVPNYFGEQRFGRDGANLAAVTAWLQEAQDPRGRRAKGSRHKAARHSAGGGPKGMVVSAARSWLFNQVLAERVRQGNWQTTLPGDPDAFGTGPLWGRGRNLSSATVLDLEAQVLAPWATWCDGLEHAGLSQARRPLTLQPGALSWRLEARDLVVSFELLPGQYATAVLREICELTAPITR